MSTKTKTKRIKAWAIVVIAGNGEPQIEFADDLVDNECPAHEPTKAMAIYYKRDLAESVKNDSKVIPVIITLQPPKKRKK